MLVERWHASLLLHGRLSCGGVQLQIRSKCQTILCGREGAQKMLATATHCIPTTLQRALDLLQSDRQPDGLGVSMGFRINACYLFNPGGSLTVTGGGVHAAQIV